MVLLLFCSSFLSDEVRGFLLLLNLLDRFVQEYPYPFLDAMQQPDGILMMFLFGVSSLFLFFKAGSKLASRGSSSQLKKLKLI